MAVVGVDLPSAEIWHKELIEIGVVGKTISVPVSVILDLVYYDEGDLIFLSGSLIEGIGNLLSDLDVYVVKKNKLIVSSAVEESHDSVRVFLSADSSSGKSVATYDYIPQYALNVEVEYWTFADVNLLIKGVNEKSSVSAFFGMSPKLDLPSFKTSRLVHNIVTAIPLVGHEYLASFVSSFQLPSYCFMRFNSLAGSYEDFKDLAGVYMSGDFLRAYDLVREFVTVQMHALTHLHFNTNFRRKWLLTYLQKLPSEYDAVIARYTELVYEPIAPGSLEYKFLELVRFLGDVFSAFGTTLENSPAFLDGRELLFISKDFNDMSEDAETQRIISFRRMVVGDKLFDAKMLLTRDYWR